MFLVCNCGRFWWQSLVLQCKFRILINYWGNLLETFRFITQGILMCTMFIMPFGSELVADPKSLDVWALNITLWLWIGLDVPNNVSSFIIPLIKINYFFNLTLNLIVWIQNTNFRFSTGLENILSFTKNYKNQGKIVSELQSTVHYFRPGMIWSTKWIWFVSKSKKEEEGKVKVIMGF